MDGGLDLEGFLSSSFFCHCFAKLLPEAFPDLKKAFFAAANPRLEPSEIVENIHAGKLVVMASSLVKEHCLFLVVHKSFMIICNRGLRPRGNSSMASFKINSSKFTQELVMAIMKGRPFPTDDRNLHYLYVALPESVSDTGKIIDSKIDRECALLETIAPSRQRADNCTAASVKTAIRTADALLHYDPSKKSPLSREALHRSYINSKLFSLLLRADTLERYKRFWSEDTLFFAAKLKQIKLAQKIEKKLKPSPLVLTAGNCITWKEYKKGVLSEMQKDLFDAAEKGDVDQVAAILTKGEVDLDFEHPVLGTLLGIATYYDQKPLIELLTKKGATRSEKGAYCEQLERLKCIKS